ncbi:mucin-1-like [Homarus americanus]|uniref:mucin-1-like n=1 Tax=Homarus americanus TaxID=6706 RepID=UPI001C45A6A0|nr:mucin-1-like [Homarus americanus]
MRMGEEVQGGSGIDPGQVKMKTADYSVDCPQHQPAALTPARSPLNTSPQPQHQPTALNTSLAASTPARSPQHQPAASTPACSPNTSPQPQHQPAAPTPAHSLNTSLQPQHQPAASTPACSPNTSLQSPPAHSPQHQPTALNTSPQPSTPAHSPQHQHSLCFSSSCSGKSTLSCCSQYTIRSFFYTKNPWAAQDCVPNFFQSVANEVLLGDSWNFF